MASFKDHYSDRAAQYSASRPTYPRELGESISRMVARRRLAWEAGCGSGQVTVMLSGFFQRVAATDASALQLAQAQRHANVRYWCALAESSGLRAGSADLAISAQAAHWFDLPAYYAEVRRVTRPGGLICLVTYGIVRAGAEVDPLLEEFEHQVIQPWWPPERHHVEEGYAGFPFPFRELEDPGLEMAVEWTFGEFFGYLRTWSAVRALEMSQGPEEVESFGRRLERAWGAGARSVRWPLTVRAGRI
ncbi:MAG TPA: class I SAM-dependent methyltransferase [Acidobacteriota bacterium]|nr:class I SAM-dependent methyltransferase [Acidobacteriota bacterium]